MTSDDDQNSPQASSTDFTTTKPRLRRQDQGISDASLKQHRVLQRRSLTAQENPVQELKFVSQPSGIPVSELSNYAYDDTGGEDITVFVLDTGADTTNWDYGNMTGNKRWLWPDTDYWNANAANPMTETDEVGHGSCVLSKIGGSFYGVAKNVDVVIAKMIASRQQSSSSDAIILEWRESQYLYLLSLILQDIYTKELVQKSVVNLSQGFWIDPRRPGAAHLQNSFIQLVQGLISYDAVVVISSGNNAVSLHPPRRHRGSLIDIGVHNV